jgi:RNA polymerase sigma-70 factor (ECF subfamily)
MDLKEQYTKMVMQHKDIIYKVCYIYAEKDYIEDYYQEVLIELWRSFPHFRSESKASTWIYRISLNTCISFVRKKKRNPFTKKLSLDIDVFDEGNEKAQQLEELYKLINQLNKLEKSIILLWLEEVPYEEIASITGLSLSNVGVKISRIKEKLKQMSNQ